MATILSPNKDKLTYWVSCRTYQTQLAIRKCLSQHTYTLTHRETQTETLWYFYQLDREWKENRLEHVAPFAMLVVVLCVVHSATRTNNWHSLKMFNIIFYCIFRDFRLAKLTHNSFSSSWVVPKKKVQD